jgi:putative transposase
VAGSGTCCMKERVRFIAEYRKGEQSMASLCRAAGISRKTGYQWVERWLRPGGWDGCAARSGRRPWVITAAMAEKIMQLREQYPFEGPKKLVVRLSGVKRRPAASTIGDFLRRHGLVAKRRRRRHPVPASRPFAKVAEPNDLWTVDRKGWFRTRNRKKCEPLTVMDGASRYLLYNRHLKPVTYRKVRAVFERLFRLHGMPSTIRTDNGGPFASIGPAGLSQLAVWWLKLGLRLERIDVGRPEQNGRHERMHLTLKQQVCVPVANDLNQQQRELDRFRTYYNTDRPHEALGQRTPASVYHRSARAYPARLEPLVYADDCEVRRVRSNGTIKWHGRAIYISQALRGELLGVKTNAEAGYPVYFGNILLGVIEPGRWKLRYQPRSRKPPASKKTAVPQLAQRLRLRSEIDLGLDARAASAREPGQFFPPPSKSDERAAEKIVVEPQPKTVTQLPVQTVTHLPVAQG